MAGFNRIVPTELDLPKHYNVVKIACGYRHSLMLTDKGKVLACGDNSSGQIFESIDRYQGTIKKPISVCNLPKFKRNTIGIAAGNKISSIVI